jgi:hypothetical protein
MKHPVEFVVLVIFFAGCAEAPRVNSRDAALPPRLNSYFETYCDYTGGLGIGFDPSHTYDYRFRQHLKTVHDPELKRLFVLQNLHRNVEFALNDFERGIMQTGKSSSRPLTLSEWQSTRQNIETQINDLVTYSAFTNFAVASNNPFDQSDSGLDVIWIDELRARLHSITNIPASRP